MSTADGSVGGANSHTIITDTVALNRDRQPLQSQQQKQSDKKREKRKLSEDVTLEDLLQGWTQCCYLLKKKMRLCNIQRCPNSLYCGNHRPPEELAGYLSKVNDLFSKQYSYFCYCMKHCRLTVSLLSLMHNCSYHCSHNCSHCYV